LRGDITLKDYNKMALELHEKSKGKISIASKVKLESRDDLSIAYTPGVAEPCRKINQNKSDVYKYTSKGNLVAVVTDGTAVLGLGDIGPEAGLPVMEGKAILFKAFADVDAFPICLSSTDTEEIIKAVKMIAPTFGGINLEDISAPRCIEIEERLRKELDIPVFHDDQHGTAIVVCAGLINALKLVNKSMSELKIAINGAGAAGSAIVKMLLSLGATNITICDTKGILHKNMDTRGNFLKDELCKITNPHQITGTLEDAMKDADVFIGVSAADMVNEPMVKSMAKDSIIFAMANPVPEIMPDIAISAGAKVVGTGRSDFANQINNVLAFPGIFRGALDVRASDINEDMKIAAAYAIANIIPEDKLSPEYVIPDALDKEVAKQVAKAVAEAAIKTGVARI